MEIDLSFYEILGWLGLLLMLLSYYLLSDKKLKATGDLYQGMNFFGALFLGINAYSLDNWPIVALEIFWIIISIQTIYKARTKKRD